MYLFHIPPQGVVQKGESKWEHHLTCSVILIEESSDPERTHMCYLSFFSTLISMLPKLIPIFWIFFVSILSKWIIEWNWVKDGGNLAINPLASRKDGLLGGCGLRADKALTRSPLAKIHSFILPKKWNVGDQMPLTGNGEAWAEMLVLIHWHPLCKAGYSDSCSWTLIIDVQC